MKGCFGSQIGAFSRAESTRFVGNGKGLPEPESAQKSGGNTPVAQSGIEQTAQRFAQTNGNDFGTDTLITRSLIGLATS